MKAKNRKRDDEFAELHSLEFRLDELLMSCRGVAIGMNDDLTVEVWANVRGDGRPEMVKLADGPDLREAMRRAYLAMPPARPLHPEVARGDREHLFAQFDDI